MSDTPNASQQPFLRLAALHKYFLNADFLRGVFMRRIKRKQSPADTSFVESIDDTIAMSLWYATVYVVIEGWHETGLTDPELDVLPDMTVSTTCVASATRSSITSGSMTIPSSSSSWARTTDMHSGRPSGSIGRTPRWGELSSRPCTAA